MTNRALQFLIGAAALAAALPAAAQDSATATATGSVTVIQPITLNKSTDLSFGTLVRPNTGSNTVTVDQTTGNRTLTGGGDGSLSSGGSSPASFAVGGDGGLAFSISVPASFNMTRSGGSETVPVSLTASAATGALSGSLGSAGSASFNVGGSLPLTATTVAGSYTGTFNVTVGYN